MGKPAPIPRLSRGGVARRTGVVWGRGMRSKGRAAVTTPPPSAAPLLVEEGTMIGGDRPAAFGGPPP